MTAGAARVFGWVLTLLFTTTAVTVAVDVAALQCAGEAPCQGLWTWGWDLVIPIVPAEFRTPGRLLAVAALLVIGAVLILAWFAGRARRTYDTLLTRPGMVGVAANEAVEVSRNGGPEAAATDAPILRQRAFWSNRITGRLAVVHVAGALALTTAQVAGHVAFGPGADAPAPLFAGLTVTAWALLALTGVAAAIMPTQTITPQGSAGGAKVAALAWIPLGLSAAGFAILVVALWAIEPSSASGVSLYAADIVPLGLVTLGALIALSGLSWRRDHRGGTAWNGCGPALFLTVSLALAILTSAAVLGLLSIVVLGVDGPAALGRGLIESEGGLRVPGVFLAVGGLVTWALLPFLLIAGLAFAWRRSLNARAETWAAPRVETLDKKIARSRSLAAFVHAMEPATALLGMLLGVAIVAGLVWAWMAFAQFLPSLGAPSDPDRGVAGFVGLTAWMITVVGVLLAVVVGVVGVLRSKPGFIAIVWDITCFLPRTAQPFGPPCYAERAVPDIAQRLHDWLAGSPDRHAVLAAHSMGGMAAVAALALLAETDPASVKRVSLLTFGVQLRVFFGRFLPELVGPGVLGTYPSRAPRLWRPDPWSDDVGDTAREWQNPPMAGAALDCLEGRLLAGTGVRWISLWRLTDYLGFPALSGTPEISSAGQTWLNKVDRYADEVDYTVDPPVVVKHNDYIRVATYQAALLELAEVATARR